MVGELEVIFRIGTITLRLRVTCQVLVLFKKLGSVAARTVIDAITRISAPAITLRARVVPTATAAGLTIIDQRRVIVRSEEHTSELQSLMRISYAVFCLKQKKTTTDET